MNRRDVLAKAKFALFPLLGLYLLVAGVTGWCVGLVYPPWGAAIWGTLGTLADWVDV